MKYLKYVSLIFFGPILLYLLFAVVSSLIPVNTNFQSYEGKDVRTIYVYSNGVHTDFLFPLKEERNFWSEFLQWENLQTLPDDSWLEIGWGERDFYLYTPEWKDLTVSTAVSAMLWPNESVVHVDYRTANPKENDHTIRLQLSPEQYSILKNRMINSFLKVKDKTVYIEGHSFNGIDRFYAGAISYHCFRTCNSWTNSSLKEAGIRTALWTPFDKAILYHLK